MTSHAPDGPTPGATSFARFVAGGAIIYAISCSLTLLFHELGGLSRFAAYALTQACLPFIAFFVNRQWTFRATGDARRMLFRFLLANASFRVVDWCLYALVTLLFEPPIIVAITVANLIVFPAKFFFYRDRVFAREEKPLPR